MDVTFVRHYKRGCPDVGLGGKLQLIRGQSGVLDVQENPHRKSWRDRLPGD